MNITLNQLMLIPWGYSMIYNVRTYKARLDKPNAEELVKAVGNANITNTYLTKSGKVIVTIREFSNNSCWNIVERFVPKKTKSRQLAFKLK